MRDYSHFREIISWVSTVSFPPTIETGSQKAVISEIMCVGGGGAVCENYHCSHYQSDMSRKRIKKSPLKGIYSANEMEVNVIITKPKLRTAFLESHIYMIL